MRKGMIMAAACAALALAPSLHAEAPPAPFPSLTLAETYALAEARHEAFPIFEAEGRAAEARYRETMGDRWPQVDAFAGALWRGTQETDRQTEDQYRAGVGGSWTIFNGLRTLRAAEARRVEGQAFAFDALRERQLLYEDVADAFYQVLAFEGELDALDGQVTALNQRIDELERRVALGRSRQAELLTARAQVADVRVDIEQLRGFLDATREIMAFLTGLPADGFTLREESAMPLATDVSRYLREIDRRPDLEAAATRARAARLDVEAAQAEDKPEISAGANLYLLSDPGEAGDWDLSLQAELPIFDKGIRQAGVAAQKEQVLISELQLSALRRSADRDVRLAYRDVLSALGQWAALQDAIRVTRENHETQQRDYELGRASNLDVLQALIQLYNLRRREAQLAMQARAAMVRLHVAAGGEAP
jgi:outer membrane protein TolC